MYNKLILLFQLIKYFIDNFIIIFMQKINFESNGKKFKLYNSIFT